MRVRFGSLLMVLLTLMPLQLFARAADNGAAEGGDQDSAALDLICLRDQTALYRVFIHEKPLAGGSSEDTVYSATVIQNPDRRHELRYVLNKREFTLRPSTAVPVPKGYFFFDKLTKFELRCKVNGGYRDRAAMTIGN